MSDGPSIDQEIETFLAACRTATLATVGADGRPHAANVQYAHGPGWRLHWISSPGSRHSQHVEREPAAAMTVYAHEDGPEQIHGLQLHGRVEWVIAAGEDGWPGVWDLYTGKYGFVKSSPPLRAAAERQKFYIFRPTWLRWIDNRRGFGFKVEKELGEGFDHEATEVTQWDRQQGP